MEDPIHASFRIWRFADILRSINLDGIHPCPGWPGRGPNSASGSELRGTLKA
jgi:hypothetical protein